MIQEVLFFMVQYDVEAFMAACERKGLAEKTMGSYEQTLRLFGQFLSQAKSNLSKGKGGASNSGCFGCSGKSSNG